MTSTIPGWPEGFPGPPSGPLVSMPRRLADYFLARAGTRTAPASPRSASRGPQEGIPSRYGVTALVRECEAVRSAQEGSRNHTLNRSAWMIGRLVTSGDLDAVESARRLYVAGREAGLGRHECERTIRSGFASRGVDL